MRHRSLTLCLAVCWLSSFLTARAANDLEQRLRDQYQGKTLVLRGFYSGSALHYDADGSVLDARGSGDWTLDGVVQVKDLKVSRDRLKISASRIHLGWIYGSGMTPVHDQAAPGKANQDERKNRALEIEAELGPGGATVKAADAAMRKIFLTANDSFADIVPDYWQPCIRAALGAVAENDPNMRDCTLSADFLAVPGVAHPSDSPVRTEPDAGLKIQQVGTRSAQPTQKDGVYIVGHGVRPPRVLAHADPEFTEEARRAKFQGTVVLSMVVDKEGVPTRFHISNPIGCGLDAKAVQTVQAWRFQPGEKDGEPVPVQIAVEVDFHLY